MRGFFWISPKSSKTRPLKRLLSETRAIRQTIAASIAAFTLSSKIRRLSDVGVEPNPRLGLAMSEGLLSNSNLPIVLLPPECPQRSIESALLTEQALEATPFKESSSTIRQAYFD